MYTTVHSDGWHKMGLFTTKLSESQHSKSDRVTISVEELTKIGVGERLERGVKGKKSQKREKKIIINERIASIKAKESEVKRRIKRSKRKRNRSERKSSGNKGRRRKRSKMKRSKK